jgi:predicted DNA-binding transcriptional regulator AlpA
MTSHSNRLLRVGEVADILGVSRSYVYKLAQNSTSFPKPIILGDESNRRSSSRWVLTEIEDWVNTRPRGKEYDTEG